jgi:hypothetical protein
VIDLSLVQDNDTGYVMLHRADCSLARKMADAGHPVITMFGCETVPDDMEKHDCLGEKDAVDKQ